MKEFALAAITSWPLAFTIVSLVIGHKILSMISEAEKRTRTPANQVG